MVMPVGAYYKGGLKPVRAVILDDWDRAAPNGMGDVKVGGNYAASLYAHEKAKHDGWPVELYLDAKTHRYVEEFSTSNFIGITKDGTYVTPDSNSILPSITNMSLKECAADLGWKVECRPIPYEEISSFVEVAACGTAVVVTPVWEITRGNDVIRICDQTHVGEHLQKLYDTVQGIQYGTVEDTHGWCHEVVL
jgi:branched-chain amino acid aminotransferase